MRFSHEIPKYTKPVKIGLLDNNICLEKANNRNLKKIKSKQVTTTLYDYVKTEIEKLK